jgi:hypothetical protein
MFVCPCCAVGSNPNSAIRIETVHSYPRTLLILIFLPHWSVVRSPWSCSPTPYPRTFVQSYAIGSNSA